MPECPCCGKQPEVVNGRFASHGCREDFAFADQAGTTLESRFTPPSMRCPHPERWHSLDADSAETEVSALVAAFVTALRPTLVVETGSAWGQTAEAIGKALDRAGVGVLHTIEPDPERADHTRQRCEGLPVVVEQMKSLDFTPPDKVGFAWFDSLLELRVDEFRHYHQHLAEGAIVGFHDTGEQFGPFRDHIMELETEGLLLPLELRTPRGLILGEAVP